MSVPRTPSRGTAAWQAHGDAEDEWPAANNRPSRISCATRPSGAPREPRLPVLEIASPTRRPGPRPSGDTFRPISGPVAALGMTPNRRMLHDRRFGWTLAPPNSQQSPSSIIQRANIMQSNMHPFSPCRCGGRQLYRLAGSEKTRDAAFRDDNTASLGFHVSWLWPLLQEAGVHLTVASCGCCNQVTPAPYWPGCRPSRSTAAPA
jgi:hypothetical protein